MRRALILLVLCAGSALAAQAPSKPDAPRPAPRHANGRIDISGLWQGGGPIANIADGLPKGETIPLLPEARRVLESRESKDDPQASCLPSGVPRIAPYPWRIVETPTHVFFLFEANIHSYRQIFMDGRAHPDDLEATWYGHSVGHWEGDTLVVETVGFNDQFWFDFVGHPHTTQLKTVERYTRKDEGTLENVTTITDPGAYAKPFTIKFTATLRPGWDLMEYICNENNQDVEHIRGKAGL